MTWIDSHCHLQLDGRLPSELLARAPEVAWVVVPGVDAASSEAAARLAGEHPARVLFTTGLHPHDAERFDHDWPQIEALAAQAAGVGETGLDYYRNLAPPEQQRRSFLAHIELAVRLDLPLVVHCRDAFADVFDLVSSSGVGGRTILHCWTGGPRWTKRFLELGVTFSFAGPVAFETGDTVRRGAAVVPPERALVETDTPYLSPPPHRSEPNEPARVALVGAALAAVWGIEPAAVAANTTARAIAMFGGPA